MRSSLNLPMVGCFSEAGGTMKYSGCCTRLSTADNIYFQLKISQQHLYWNKYNMCNNKTSFWMYTLLVNPERDHVNRLACKIFINFGLKQTLPKISLILYPVMCTEFSKICSLNPACFEHVAEFTFMESFLLHHQILQISLNSY